MKKLVPAIVFMAIVPAVASGQQSPKSTGPSGNATKEVAEKYEAVTSPSELGLDVQVGVTRMEFGNSAGGPVYGIVSSLTIRGKQLALTSPEIVQDDNGSWITTKDYGRIRIASGALGRGMVIYLKPSQKASLLKLYKETKSPMVQLSKPIAAAQASGMGAKNSTAPPKNAQPEEYHVVDPAKVGFKIVLKVSDMTQDSLGTIAVASISSVLIDDQPSPIVEGHEYPIELVSNEVKGGVTQTKQFGDFKIRSNGVGTIAVLMTNGQVKKLQTFVKTKMTVADLTAHSPNTKAPAATEEQANVPLRTTPAIATDSLLDVVKRGDLATLRTRLSAGSNPNAPDDSIAKGWTPLMEAAYSGNIDAASLLLESGAAINARTERGSTALDMAVRGDKPRMAAFLRSRGAQGIAAALETQAPPTAITPARIGGDNVQKLRCASAGDRVGYVFSVDFEHNAAKLLVSGIELKVTSAVGDDDFAFEATGRVHERFIINRTDLSFTDIPESTNFPIALRHMGQCGPAPTTPAVLPSAPNVGTLPSFPSTATGGLTVKLLFTVKDSKGRFVTDIGKESFYVIEDQKPQRIASFQPGNSAPFQYVLIYEPSHHRVDDKQHVVRIESRKLPIRRLKLEASYTANSNSIEVVVP